VDILAVLVERFGARCTLGQAYAASYLLKEMSEGRKPSIADIARETGCSKQNLSRWLQNHIDIGHIAIQPAEEDARRLEITVTDPKRAYRHLNSLAQILGCDTNPPRDRERGSACDSTGRNSTNARSA
jgi:DNA-binding MarR family transcriptional regulator